MTIAPNPSYVLITPAKNEEMFIRNVLESVVSQTLRPVRWVIVNDSSTDHTAEIIQEYVSKYEFISLLNMQADRQRDFGRKAVAFNSGFAQIQNTDFSYIGNLDADISLAPDYFQNIVNELERNPKLGIAGGIVYTKIGSKFVTGDKTLDSVGGAVQLFRRECFQQIGGYLPLRQGGIDAAAEITARMKGWTVRKFPENQVWEHRTTGTANDRVLAANFKWGMRFHSLGYGTLFYVIRSIAKMKNKPYFIGSMVALVGFLYARLRGYPIALPNEIVSYLRKEQNQKLRHGLISHPVRVTLGRWSDR
jgi:biofilm PGA synthesis N-glycosyltransferase PgaC